MNLRIASWALTFLLAGVASWATQIRVVNLEEMTDRADRVFSARYVEQRSYLDERINRTVTEITLDVERVVKGDVAGRITIRTLEGISDLLPGGERTTRGPFVAGQSAVFFLYPDSPLGLTSPVGLGQGRFEIVEPKPGRPMAVNGFENKHLLRGLSSRGVERIERSPSLRTKADRVRNGGEVDLTALLDLADALLPDGPRP